MQDYDINVCQDDEEDMTNMSSDYLNYNSNNESDYVVNVERRVDDMVINDDDDIQNVNIPVSKAKSSFNPLAKNKLNQSTNIDKNISNK